jgi:fatty-acyl-CoA synthase
VSVWNHADIWEPIAKAQPEHPAFIHGQRTVSWGQFDAEADALAADFLRAGLSPGAKVAVYLYNCPEYLTAYYAAFKIGAAPVNTNYRYGPEELFYLFNNADAEAVVFHASFAERLDVIRARLAHVKRWVAVSEPGYAAPEWAGDYAAITAAPPEKRGVRAPWGRSSDDLLIIYTGGTTGLPKGVMWRQEDMLGVGGFGANALTGAPAWEKPEDAAARLGAMPRPITLPACPLMHATGMLTAMGTLSSGGANIFLPARRFDAAELWEEVARRRASRVVIVGLAFCAPMLDALEANPGRWDLSCVLSIVSSGAMWSYENKQGLLKHLPQASLFDSYGSTEAVGLGASMSTAGGEAATAKFMLGPNTAVFNDAHQRVAPGSGERGMVAVTGYLPLGYYKDPEKTAKTFPVIEGRRWSMPGDWAEVNADGTLKLLGRGSQTINTGGEKVFPEEVEEALKRHDTVRDAAVVGLPDARFGERICAVVELREGAPAPALHDLAAHVKAQLADYKAPRELVIVESIGRAPNGKLDYKAVKAAASAALGAG